MQDNAAEQTGQILYSIAETSCFFLPSKMGLVQTLVLQLISELLHDSYITFIFLSCNQIVCKLKLNKFSSLETRDHTMQYTRLLPD